MAKSRTLWAQSWIVATTLCVVSTAVAPVALAIDPAKVAATIATAAGNAYANGEFQRAAELYLNAFRSAAKPEYLFGAARSQHVAGQYDLALESYNKFLALDPADPARVAKAKQYIAEIAASRAATQVLDADKADRGGDHHMAAGLYYDAWRRAQRPEYLFKAATAAQAGEEKANAIQYLQEYLRKAPEDAADRRQAEIRLETLKAPAKPLPVQAAKPEPEPVVVKPVATKPIAGEPVVVQQPTVLKAQPAADWTAWGTLGAGVVLVGAGAGLALAQLGPLSDYNASLQKGADGLIHGTDLQTSKATAQSINTKVGVGIGLAVVGVGATVTGAWLLLLRAHPTTTTDAGTPSMTACLLPNGAGLAGRF